jgi:hypothetical protein
MLGVLLFGGWLVWSLVGGGVAVRVAEATG